MVKKLFLIMYCLTKRGGLVKGTVRVNEKAGYISVTK